MTVDSGRLIAPRRPLRLDAVSLTALLLAGAALAWALTVRSWNEMGNGPGTMGRELGGFVAFWVLMMAAMMLPSVSTVGILYLRTIRARTTGWTRVARSASLVAGYLGVWALFGVLAYLAAWGAGELVERSPGAGPWVGAAILIVVGAYQLSPLKARCLRHCRSPLGFLLHFGNYRGPLRDLRAGAYHGAYCVGCCWGLMAILVAVGVMNVAWMAGLAALILLEKVWRYGAELGKAFGVALIVLAFFVPWNPAIVPGLHVDEDAPAMQMEMEDRTLPAPADDDAMRMGDGAAPTQELPAPAPAEPAMEMDPAIDP